MTNKELLELIGEAGDGFVADAAPRPGKKRAGLRLLTRPLAAAACFALLAAAGFGGWALASEAKAYGEATRFFSEYSLSTEGLSRSEIKAVYRDITTNSFTYSKTAEVIINSMNGSVSGQEIFQDAPTPDDVESLWNYKNSYGFPVLPKSGLRFEFEHLYREDGVHSGGIFDRSVLKKYDGETLLWEREFSGLCGDGCEELKCGVLAYGWTPRSSNLETQYCWLALLDGGGNILWQSQPDNGFRSETVSAVVDNGDGSFAVISRGDLNYLCVSRYDASGERLSFTKTEIGNYGIWNAARLGDGYIVQLASYVTGEYSKIVKVDGDGGVTDAFSYRSDNCVYYITDMLEYNGNVYLSAYSVPLADGESPSESRYDIAPVLDYLFENQRLDISSEELTPMVRANFTALLLVCSPESGVPREFYAVKGSLGGKLSLDGENLLWKVESITDTFFSPATSSFTIGGTNIVYRYSFDSDGRFLKQEKTGELTGFRR